MRGPWFACMLIAHARSSTWLPWFGLGTLLVLAWGAYSPGLTGDFLFDDFVNLNALGSHGPITNWPRFWIYLTSGTADPLGRPLSLLSFLLDGRDWPADPTPFLRSNVLLHLLNGALLFGLLRSLGQALAGERRDNDATALLAAGLWLLHPLFVSTTLYIVQREAMLPATFTLLGLWLYVDGRARYLGNGGRTGTARMLLAIVAGTLLAMLSKANGLLLPLLAWVLASTVLQPGDRRELSESALARLRRLDRWLLIAPSLVIFGYVLSALPHLHDPLGNRPWTIGQRLLTEPRILVEYLGLLAVPRSISTGLFNDDYLVSSSWLQPATTLPSILIVLGLLALAFRSRQSSPRLAAALLFYFAGQLLESTTIPLELYFEHRNYLPAMLLFWPLAHAIVGWRVGRSARAAVAVALLALMATTTWQRALLWGQPEQLSALWARQNPDSPRAEAVASMALMKQGQYEQAAVLLKRHWRQRPGEVQLAFNYINARCAGPGLTADDADAVTHALQSAVASHLLISQWLSHALLVANEQACPGMNLPVVEAWIRAALANPALAAAGRREEDFEPLLGELAVYRGQPDRALAYFRRALRSHPNPDFAARMAAFLAGHEAYLQALALLDTYQQLPPATHTGFNMAHLHAILLDRSGYWPRELGALRRQLETEVARQAAQGTGR